MRSVSHTLRSAAAALAGVLVLSVIGARWMAVKRARDQDLSGVSPFAKTILQMGGRRWIRDETSHFVYYVPDIKRLVAIQDVTEYAYARVRESFPGAADGERGIVISVSEEMWNRTLRKADRRKDSLAMQVGNEIFVLESGSSADLSMRVSHEIVHYRLWQRWGSDLPVWLDEGLAGCLGWDIAEAYRQKKGWQLSRKWAMDDAVSAEDIETIVAWTEYPESEPTARALYRQSEALIRAIARRIGFGKLHEFVAGMAEGTLAWDMYLRERFGFSDYDFRWLVEEMEHNLSKGRETE